MAQWLGLCSLTYKGVGLIPGQGIKILQAERCSQKKKRGSVSISVRIFLVANNIHLFIFGCAGSSLLHGLSLTVASRGYSSLQRSGSSLWWLLLLQSTGSRVYGLQQLLHVG